MVTQMNDPKLDEAVANISGISRGYSDNAHITIHNGDLKTILTALSSLQAENEKLREELAFIKDEAKNAGIERDFEF